MIRALAGLLIMAALPAGAAELRDCSGPEANARHLATPYDEAVRTFASGNIGLLGLYKDDPANAGAFLMVLHPDPDGPGTQCALLARDAEAGFVYVAIARGIAIEDSDTAMRFDVPVGVLEAEGVVERFITLTLDRASGALTVATLPE